MLTVPIRPADFVSPRAAAPLMIDTKTRGTTSILISWMNRSPRGLKAEASGPIKMPAMIPRIMAMMIHTPRFLRSFFIVCKSYNHVM